MYIRYAAADEKNREVKSLVMDLNSAELGREYVVSKVDTGGDEEMESFLFSLGCYSGERITVVDRKKNLVVSIKDARYNMDPELGAAIHI